MNALNAIARHDRVLMICHAIRHLLDHAPEHTTLGDVEAVDVLQEAINSTDREHTTESLSASPAFLTHSEVQEHDSVFGPDANACVLGEISIDRATLNRVLDENPISLKSVLEALLHALDGEPEQPELVATTKEEILDYVQ